MTRFEKDLLTAIHDGDAGIEILRERRAELDELYQKGLKERNSWRRTCIAQEYQKLESQYNEISEWV